MPRKPKKPSNPPIAGKSPSPAPAPIRSSRPRPLPTPKVVAFADAGAPAPGSTRKSVRLRWGPEMPNGGVKQRVAIGKAEKALRAAQTGAQRTAKAVEKENARRAEQELQAEEQQQEEEEEEEEEETEEPEGNETENTDDEIDRQEEENFEYNQQIPYEYTVSWALKALYGPGPNPRKAVRWTRRIGEDWVQGQFKYNTLDLELNDTIEQLGFDSIVEVIVSVKSTNTRGTRKLLTFEELSQES